MSSAAIERSVPPPAVTRGRPARYPFRYMDVGDSFLTSADGELVAQAARGYARRRNAEIAIGRVRAQTLIEILLAMMAEDEALRLARFCARCGFGGGFLFAHFRF